VDKLIGWANDFIGICKRNPGRLRWALTHAPDQCWSGVRPLVGTPLSHLHRALCKLIQGGDHRQQYILQRTRQVHFLTGKKVTRTGRGTGQKRHYRCKAQRDASALTVVVGAKAV